MLVLRRRQTASVGSAAPAPELRGRVRLQSCHRQLKADLDERVLLRERFGRSEVERVEEPRLASERVERDIEHHRRGVRDRLDRHRRRRIARGARARLPVAVDRQLQLRQRLRASRSPRLASSRAASGSACRRSRGSRAAPPFLEEQAIDRRAFRAAATPACPAAPRLPQ